MWHHAIIVWFLDENEKRRGGNTFTVERTGDVREAGVGQESVGVSQEHQGKILVTLKSWYQE